MAKYEEFDQFLLTHTRLRNSQRQNRSKQEDNNQKGAEKHPKFPRKTLFKHVSWFCCVVCVKCSSHARPDPLHPAVISSSVCISGPAGGRRTVP